MLTQLLTVQGIDNILLDIFGSNYIFDTQECNEFYHVSVIKRDKTQIEIEEYLPIHKHFLLFDSPLAVGDRLYFKVAK